MKFCRAYANLCSRNAAIKLPTAFTFARLSMISKYCSSHFPARGEPDRKCFTFHVWLCGIALGHHYCGRCGVLQPGIFPKGIDGFLLWFLVLVLPSSVMRLTNVAVGTHFLYVEGLSRDYYHFRPPEFHAPHAAIPVER